MSRPTSTAVDREIEYPDSDGKPMAETPIHRQNLTDLIDMFRIWYAGNPDVYISGNMFVYFKEGNARRHVSPDVFVVLGVRDRGQRSYKTWEENKPTLDLVIELTSPSTRREDQEKKFELYRDELGVREYFLFDPLDEYLRPSPKGYRLEHGQYVPIEPTADGLYSEVAGLLLTRRGERLRLKDPKTGKLIPDKDEKNQESDARADQAEERAEQAEERAQRAESVLQTLQAEKQRQEMELQAEIERLRRQLGESQHP